MSTATGSSLRSTGVALAALLRRDLSAGRRGVTVATARLVVVALSGVVAVVALANAEELYGRPAEAGVAGWMLVWVLAAFSLLMLPVLSLQALRQDRASGAMELLLLAGLSPRLLAIGRWLTTFLLLESLLLDALPAITVFVFFGAPTPGELAWGALALTGWNAGLAGLALLLSATIRRAGPCIFGSILVMLALLVGSGMLSGEMGRGDRILSRPPVPTVLLSELTARRIDSSSFAALSAARHLGGFAMSLGLGGLLALWAGERLGVQSRPASAPTARSRRFRRLSRLGLPGPLRGRPLTWLLQRGAPATRPFALACALPLPLLAMVLGFAVEHSRGATSLTWRDLLAPPVLMTFAGLYWGTGLLLALAASALQVSRLRERKEWESLLATSRRGRAILLDLLTGPGLAGGVALSLSVALFTASALGAPGDLDGLGLGFAVATAAAVFATGSLMLGLGLVSGLASRSQAGALGLAILLLAAATVLGSVSAGLLGTTFLGVGFDLGSRLSAVALAASLVVPLQFWLLSRSRKRPGAGRLFFDLLLCALLLASPLLHGLDGARSLEESFAMTALAAAALGLPLIAVTLRRPDFWLGRAG